MYYLNFIEDGEFNFTCEVNEDLKQITIIRGTCKSKEMFLRIYCASIVNQILFTIAKPKACVNPKVSDLVELATSGKTDYISSYNLIHKYDNYTILQKL